MNKEEILKRLDDISTQIESLRLLIINSATVQEPDNSVLIPESSPPAATVEMSPTEKIALFRSRFYGRQDIFALRWESKTTGRSGYSPACDYEWQRPICQKPQVSCSDCPSRQLTQLTDQVIYSHLTGEKTVGIYPLLPDDTCRFLAIDCDDANWHQDALDLYATCHKLEIPVLVEVSRSGAGAHLWIFFSEPVQAAAARLLGTIIISQTCERTGQLQLSSYDRLFPNQDRMPKGGFGNLIALPLQKIPRKQGYSVFVDPQNDLRPYPDQQQWHVLANTPTISAEQLEKTLSHLNNKDNALDLAFEIESTEIASIAPWERQTFERARKNFKPTTKIPGRLPAKLKVTLAGQIHIHNSDVPPQLINRIIRLAAFPNPEFYRAQAMRMSVWGKPRVICCAEQEQEYISLPRGCFADLKQLCQDNNIALEIEDRRVTGNRIKIRFLGKLRPDQEKALTALEQHDCGILSAPTGFGKTVTAAALIGKRKLPTLILVHRTELARQWQEGLATFLSNPETNIGIYGAGKKQPTGRIDVAVFQSLSKRIDLPQFLENYSQIIVDECHHVSAASFEEILKAAKPRFVLGLSATPIRHDGHQPIIFMQCGPIIHQVNKCDQQPQIRTIILKEFTPGSPYQAEKIQDIYRCIAANKSRTTAVILDALQCLNNGRKVLLLTERSDHLQALHTEIKNAFATSKTEYSTFILHGKLSKTVRENTLRQLKQIDQNSPHLIIATGKLIGEGFDHPPLDTLILAMPISWKGTLQQYAGRLHRDSPGKNTVTIFDYLDKGNAMLLRMWERRRTGYRAIGYTISEGETLFSSSES